MKGYMVAEWYGPLPNEEKEPIKKNYSSYLKGDLATQGYKTLGLDKLEEALELSVSKATEGKITFVPK